jgi:hypothetical protein
MTVMVLAMTPLEVPAFFPFNLQTFILVATMVYARDGLAALRGASGRDRRQKGAGLIVQACFARRERARKLVAQDAARDGPELPGGVQRQPSRRADAGLALAVEAGAVQVACAKAVMQARIEGHSRMPGRQAARDGARPPPTGGRGPRFAAAALSDAAPHPRDIAQTWLTRNRAPPMSARA